MENRKVIFIVGNSRSGTTLMANILGKHPLVNSFNELHFFEKFWTEENRLFSEKKASTVLHRLFCSARIHPFEQCSKEMFANDEKAILKKFVFPIDGIEIFNEFLFFETKHKGKDIPCEQTPRNLFYLENIFQFFPNAKVILMMRDPRDSVLSQKYKWKRYFKAKNEPYPLTEAVRNFVNYHPFTMSLLWRSSVNFALSYLEHPSVKCVKFEDLLVNPEYTVKEVCEFLEIDFSSEMLDVPFAFSSVFNDEQGKKGFDKRRIGNWRKKLNSAEVFIVQKVCGDLMGRFSYQKEKVFPNPIAILYYLSVFPLKTFLVFLLNFKRNKSIFYAFVRRLKSLVKNVR